MFSKKLIYLLFSLLLVFLTLTACGEDEEENASISGKVIAKGYISSATVFVDKDGDLFKDSTEPSATTQSDGSYKITGDGLDIYPVVAQIVANTSKDGTLSVSNSYYMVAPKDSSNLSNKIISPLTTLLYTASLTGSGTTPLTAVKSALGTANDISADYLSDTNKTNAEYQKLTYISEALSVALGSWQTTMNSKTALSETNQANALTYLYSYLYSQTSDISTKVRAISSFTSWNASTFINDNFSSVPTGGTNSYSDTLKVAYAAASKEKEKTLTDAQSYSPLYKLVYVSSNASNEKLKYYKYTFASGKLSKSVSSYAYTSTGTATTGTWGADALIFKDIAYTTGTSNYLSGGYGEEFKFYSVDSLTDINLANLISAKTTGTANFSANAKLFKIQSSSKCDKNNATQISTASGVYTDMSAYVTAKGIGGTHTNTYYIGSTSKPQYHTYGSAKYLEATSGIYPITGTATGSVVYVLAGNAGTESYLGNLNNNLGTLINSYTGNGTVTDTVNTFEIGKLFKSTTEIAAGAPSTTFENLSLKFAKIGETTGNIYVYHNKVKQSLTGTYEIISAKDAIGGASLSTLIFKLKEAPSTNSATANPYGYDLAIALKGGKLQPAMYLRNQYYSSTSTAEAQSAQAYSSLSDFFKAYPYSTSPTKAYKLQKVTNETKYVTFDETNKKVYFHSSTSGGTPTGSAVSLNAENSYYYLGTTNGSGTSINVAFYLQDGKVYEAVKTNKNNVYVDYLVNETGKTEINNKLDYSGMK